MILLYMGLIILGISFCTGLIIMASYTEAIFHWKRTYTQKPLIAKIFNGVVIVFISSLITLILLSVYDTTYTIMLNESVKTCIIKQHCNDKDNHFIIAVNTEDSTDEIKIDGGASEIDELHYGEKIIVTRTTYQSPLHDVGDTYTIISWKPY